MAHQSTSSPSDTTPHPSSILPTGSTAEARSPHRGQYSAGRGSATTFRGPRGLRVSSIPTGSGSTGRGQSLAPASNDGPTGEPPCAEAVLGAEVHAWSCHALEPVPRWAKWSHWFPRPLSGRDVLGGLPTLGAWLTNTHDRSL